MIYCVMISWYGLLYIDRMFVLWFIEKLYDNFRDGMWNYMYMIFVLSSCFCRVVVLMWDFMYFVELRFFEILCILLNCDFVRFFVFCGILDFMGFYVICGIVDFMRF